MKKKLFFIAVLAGCASLVSAQTLIESANLMKSPQVTKESLRENVSISTQAKAKSAEFSVVSKSNFDGVSTLRASTATLTAKYQRPVGTMYVGYGSNFGGYIPIIVGKSNTDWVFQNKSEGATSYEWKINGTSDELTVASNGNMTFNPETIGLYYMPEITAINGNTSDSWYYGKGLKSSQNQYLVPSMNTWPLTNAERHYGGFYAGFQDGYGFGTIEIEQGENVTGVLTYYEKPQAPLSIQEIGSLIYSDSNNPLSANGKLIITVYSLKNDGTINEPVITSELYKDELISSGGANPVWYTPFRFREYDPVTELETEIELLIDYAFALELTWEDANADFGVFMSENTYNAGSAYATTDQDHAYRFGAWNTDHTIFYNKYDVMFTLEGTYPTFDVFEPSQKVTVPDAGGEAIFSYQGNNYTSILIESTFLGEDVQVEACPDWLDITEIEDIMEEDGGEQYYTNAIYVYLSGEALPAGTPGRNGNVVLSSHGVTATISVKQGDADWLPPTGIPSINGKSLVSAVRQGDRFVLTYPAGTSSVAVYNVAGQRIAEYALNSGGTYSIPASNLPKGVYLLKFAGKTNETIKVIK